MTERDMYTILAEAWGCTRDEAKERALTQLYAGTTDPSAALSDILEARAGKHGEFEDNARATWRMMEAVQAERGWPTLPTGMRHSVYMIVHKISRAVCGDPTLPDHWDDMAGYARLVADRLRSPVVPYPSDDIYSSLARGWNVSRTVALERLRAWAAARAGPRPTAPAEGVSDPGIRPGTAEDGGHHAAAVADATRPRDVRDIGGAEADVDESIDTAAFGWSHRSRSV